jgi:hypothetical protein
MIERNRAVIKGFDEWLAIAGCGQNLQRYITLVINNSRCATQETDADGVWGESIQHIRSLDRFRCNRCVSGRSAGKIEFLNVTNLNGFVGVLQGKWKKAFVGQYECGHGVHQPAQCRPGVRVHGGVSRIEHDEAGGRVPGCFERRQAAKRHVVGRVFAVRVG